MRILGPQALLNDVLASDLCIGCGGCISLCPYFKTYKGKTALIFPCNLEMGRCHAYCPKAEVDLDVLAREKGEPAYSSSPAGHYRRIMAAQAGRRLAGAEFQSGGTVSALMSAALTTGLIKTAILTDHNGLVPHPVMVNQPEAVTGCATAKYTAAPTLAALNTAQKHGNQKLGVVGTPCQVTSVAKMRANPLNKNNFSNPVDLVVGLFCTWALDTRRFIAFLSQMMDVTQIRKMDIPPPPAEMMKIQFEKGHTEIPLSQIRSLIPKGCTFCPDMTAEWADLSVGELEDRPGWNTLIVRSTVGEKLVDYAVNEGWLAIDTYPENQLKHLHQATLVKKRRALIRSNQEGLLNTEPQKHASVLRLDKKTVDAIIGEQKE